MVNPANLVDGRIVPDYSTTVGDAKRAELERHMLSAGDIVFGRRGEMGRAGLVTDAEDGWLCGTGSLRLRFRGEATEPAYIKLLLETAPLRAYFSIASVGSTMENLNAEIVLAAPVLVPPLVQQRSIVDRVRELQANRHRTVGGLRRQIALLKERRQALITAAVTGELDVTKGAA
jgi:type I restriction enzyme S subunit